MSFHVYTESAECKGSLEMALIGVKATTPGLIYGSFASRREERWGAMRGSHVDARWGGTSPKCRNADFLYLLSVQNDA